MVPTVRAINNNTHTNRFRLVWLCWFGIRVCSSNFRVQFFSVSILTDIWYGPQIH